MLIHGSELVVHPDCPGIFEGLTRPRDIIGRWGPPAPGSGARSAVRDLRLPGGHFYFKIYTYTGLWRLRTLFIVSRARREYLNLLRMAGLGFRVPPPAAYGQERILGFVSTSFVMTRAVEGAVSLRALIDAPSSAPWPLPSPAERRRLVEEFARTLRRAHEEGFFIHTLKGKNLLLAREEGEYRLYVIDVPFAGIWRWRIFRERGRVRDLAVLMRAARRLLTRTERMRFARAYGADAALLRKAQAYQERYYP
jgi:hypothetical protein